MIHSQLLKDNNPVIVSPCLYNITVLFVDKASADAGKVPSIFHSLNFDLSDIDIFHQVFPWSDIETSQKSQKLYQEKVWVILFLWVLLDLN